MNDLLKPFNQENSQDTHRSTSLPVLADGPTPSGSPDGQTTNSSGPAPVPVSRFRAQDSEKAMPINDISWPAFHNLISECQPSTIFGEQVASKDGREWFSAVRADLERSGYACGCADLAAASVGAPHIRQRLFWVADTESGEAHSTAAGRLLSELADGGGLGDSERDDGAYTRAGDRSGSSGTTEGTRASGQPGGSDWNDIELIPCADGKTRVTQPGLRPLAHGVSQSRGKAPRLRQRDRPASSRRVHTSI